MKAPANARKTLRAENATGGADLLNNKLAVTDSALNIEPGIERNDSI
jgi:hypothetical protein